MVACLIVLQVFLQRSAMQQASGASALPAALVRALVGIPRAFPPLLWAAAGVRASAGTRSGPPPSSVFSAGAAARRGGSPASPSCPSRWSAGSPAPAGSRQARYQALRAPRGALRALFGREVAVITSNSSTLFEARGRGPGVPPHPGDLLLHPARRRPPGCSASSPPLPGRPSPCFGVLALMTGINTVSSTSISREGRTFALSLMLPVPGRVQLRAKLLLHLAVFGIGLRRGPRARLRRCCASPWRTSPTSCPVARVPAPGVLLLDPPGPAAPLPHLDSSAAGHEAEHERHGGHGSDARWSVGVHAAVAAGLLALGLPASPRAASSPALSLGEAAVALPAVYRYADRRYGGELEALTA